MSLRKRKPKEYLAAAVKAGLTVTNKGGHTKVYAPVGRGYMIIRTHGDLPPFEESKIQKWLLKAGVVLGAVLLAIAYLESTL